MPANGSGRHAPRDSPVYASGVVAVVVVVDVVLVIELVGDEEGVVTGSGVVVTGMDVVDGSDVVQATNRVVAASKAQVRGDRADSKDQVVPRCQESKSLP